MDHVDESVSGKNNSSLGNWSVLGNVILWENLIFSWGNSVIDMYSDFEGLISEFGEFDGVSLFLSELELSNEIIGEAAEFSPGILGEWSLWCLVVVINNIVPNGMEFVGSIVVLEGEIIATFIALWKVSGVSIRAMEGLVNITHVMDNESEGHRFSFNFTISVFHNSLISKSVRDIFAHKPVVDLWHNSGDVLLVERVLHIGCLGFITEEWLIIEMPVRLPSSASSLVVIW